MNVSSLPSQLFIHSYTQAALFALVSWLLYICMRAIYRLTFHPLAKYPGPKLAAVTLWYEFYYEYIKRGQYMWKIQKMHAQYGPIVRISPRELHIDDPDFYDVLFTQRLDRDPWVCAQFGQSDSTQATASTDLHRGRRAVLSPFFSKAKITQFQSVITDKADKLCRILQKHRETGEPVNMYNLYRAFTTDVITEYAFVHSWDFLDKPDDVAKWLHETVRDGAEAAALLRHFPWITPIMDRLPPRLALFLVPALKAQYDLEDVLEVDINKVKEEGAEATIAGKQHPTILRELILNESLPPSEREFHRVMAEAGLVLNAGHETTGNALNALHFHLLANPEELNKLKEELKGEIQGQWDTPSWQQLKKLPYLTACIDEALRVSSGVPHRLARLAPKSGLAWQGKVIPEGTPVSMSSYQMHMNPTVFPNPTTFLPERWLGPDSKQLKKYFAPFAKGPRMCLGIELAYAEMYLCIAMVLRRFETELYETTREDIDLRHDFFLGFARDESEGLRIKVK